MARLRATLQLDSSGRTRQQDDGHLPSRILIAWRTRPMCGAANNFALGPRASCSSTHLSSRGGAPETRGVPELGGLRFGELP